MNIIDCNLVVFFIKRKNDVAISAFQKVFRNLVVNYYYNKYYRIVTYIVSSLDCNVLSITKKIVPLQLYLFRPRRRLVSHNVR